MRTRLVFAQRVTYGKENPSSLPARNLLKYKLSEIENFQLTLMFKTMNAQTFRDPHRIIVHLQTVENSLKISLPNNVHLLSVFGKEISSLIPECKQVLKSACKLCRKLNQSTQRNLYEKNYDEFICAVEEIIIKQYPLWPITQKIVVIVKEIIKYSDGMMLQAMTRLCEQLQMCTCDHHTTMVTLPQIKSYTYQAI